MESWSTTNPFIRRGQIGETMRNWQADPNRIKCFFIEPTGDCEVELYRSSDYRVKMVCPNSSYGGGHFTAVMFGVEKDHDENGEVIAGGTLSSKQVQRYGLDKFPTQCACGYRYTDSDEYGHRRKSIYMRRDNSSVRYTLRDAPVGAMYFATWYEKYPEWCGLDGHALVVKVHGSQDWHVDGRASNCTKPDDSVHKCWCRHGDPSTGEVTVDKNGNTCSAGAGSLMLRDWHGFLTAGWLHV